MARFTDILPSQQSWIHDLAKAEIHPDAERLLQLGKDSDPQQKLRKAQSIFCTGALASSAFKALTAPGNIYVCAGTYVDAPVVGQAVNIYGGLDCEPWLYSASNTTTIAPAVAGTIPITFDAAFKSPISRSRRPTAPVLEAHRSRSW